MNLIDVYVQEVTRRLPEKTREDIGLELRSTIEDMLPDDYDAADVNSVLEKLGNPAALAGKYRDEPMHLIGPRYYDVYVTLLKMIIPITAVIALITMIAKYVVGFDADVTILNVILHTVGEGIWTIIEVGIHVFFWLTLIFAILDRTDKGKYGEPLSSNLKKWTPKDLKSVPYASIKKKITKLSVFGSLMWTAIWATLYFNADQLLGVYDGSGAGLEFVMPALNQEVLLTYWPFVVAVIVLEIGFALYKLIIGKWTGKMAASNTALELISTIVFVVILSNPNLLQPDFITYMGELFNTTATQIKTWFIGGIIIILILSAAMSIYDSIRKARIR